MNVGRNFTEMTTSTFESSSETTILVLVIVDCYYQSPKAGIAKGFNFSIVNVALVANHIALITASLIIMLTSLSVLPYHIIEYKKRYSFFWGLGATAGMSSWFFILVNVLKAYRKTLKISSVVWVLNNLGSVLILIGIFSLFTILWNIVQCHLFHS